MLGPLESQGTHSTVSGCLNVKYSLQPAAKSFSPLASSWDFSWTQTCVPTVPETKKGLKPSDGQSPPPRQTLGCCLDSFLKERESQVWFYCCQRSLYWNGPLPWEHSPHVGAAGTQLGMKCREQLGDDRARWCLGKGSQVYNCVYPPDY